MVKFNIFAGGAAAFIITYSFNSDDRTLTSVQNLSSGPSPTWIEKSVVKPYVLYAVNYIEGKGGIQTFGIENGNLTSGSTYPSLGTFPSHILALPTGGISVVNLGQDQNVVIWPSNGGNLSVNATEIPFRLPSAPFQTVLYENEILVPDPGKSTIWRLVRDQSNVFSIAGELKQPSGATARTAAIFSNTLVLHADSNTIISQSIPLLVQGQNNSDNIFNISIGSNSSARFFGDILIPSPNQFFPSTLVYTSILNDSDGSGDSIAIISLQSNGALKLVKQLSTGLKEIRGMRIGGPDDKYLVAGGSSGGGIIMWERVEKGYNLKQIASDKDAPEHTSFVWANMDN